MKNIKHFTLAVVSLCSAAFVSLSCQNEDKLLPKGLDGSKYVYLKTGVDGSLDTKAGSSVVSSELIDLSEDGVDLFLEATVSVNTMDPFAEQPKTKGAAITNGTFEKKTEFFVNMYGNDFDELGKTAEAGINGNNNDFWSLYYYANQEKNGQKIEWPSENTYSFLAYYYDGYEDFSSKDDDFTGLRFINDSETATKHFEYNGPADGTSAQGMKDFVVAYSTKSQQADQYNPNAWVDLHFYHAFAGVRFKFADSSVKRVVIHNVVKDGTLTINPDGKPLVTVPSDNQFFDWTLGENKASYVAGSFSAADSTIDEEGKEGEDPTGNIGVSGNNDDNAIFFLIPQAVADVKISFVIEKEDGKTFEITTTGEHLFATDDIFKAWNAGYMYTYTISSTSDGNVGITVVDKVETAGTANVHNDKRSTVYIRAAVIGNWVNSANQIMESWTADDQSGWVTYDNDSWEYDQTAGYFYYTKPVLAYESTADLIKEWQPTDESKTIRGMACTLKLEIMAQAIEASEANVIAAWRSEVADAVGFAGL